MINMIKPGIRLSTAPTFNGTTRRYSLANRRFGSGNGTTGFYSSEFAPFYPKTLK